MNRERYRAACAVIKDAIGYGDKWKRLLDAGHSAQAISDAAGIAQAGDIDTAMVADEAPRSSPV
jgi:hypothetical protein